jgi:decaprenylphospho-beta-D-ribofuranose 2-oxidase
MDELIQKAEAVRIAGFGQSEYVQASVVRPETSWELLELFAEADSVSRNVVLRGSGLSYGDAAILEGGIVADCTAMNKILAWDPTTGVIECEGGVTIESLWRRCLPDGWWPPVVSGTMYSTLGGALGMNIHGKNAFKVGTLGDHVVEFDLATPSGQLLTFTSDDPRFFEVIGSFGILGAVVRVKLQMKRVRSGDLKVFASAPRNWAEQIEMFETYSADAPGKKADYMVSWVDCFASGERSGQGQFHVAWHVHQDDPKSLQLEHQDLPSKILGVFPKSSMWRFLKPFNNRTGVRLVNRAKDFVSRTRERDKTVTQSLVAFSFLLDYVPNWRNSYLPGGFIQYQSFVPKEHAAQVFARQMALQQEAKLESFLGVLKRHHPDKYLVSHGVEGYSLALDFKVTDANRTALWELCHRMNDVVLESGGRFYFAKDSTLRPSDVRAYLGEGAIDRLKELRKGFDPKGILATQLARRLELL